MGLNKSSRPAFGFILLALSAVTVYTVSQSGLFTFEQLVENKDLLKSYVTEHSIAAAVLFVVLYFLSTTFSLPLALVLSLAGGFMFGTFKGALYINMGATSGATVLFIACRYFFGDYFQAKYGANIKALNHELETNGTHYLLTLRLIPIFPFFLVNLMAGLSTITLKTFIWTTALGIIPGSLVYAYAGSQLSQIQSPDDVVSPSIIAALTMLGILTFLPTIYAKLKRR